MICKSVIWIHRFLSESIVNTIPISLLRKPHLPKTLKIVYIIIPAEKKKFRLKV
jgi:hypothetical protein